MSDGRSCDELDSHPVADDRAIEALLAAAQTRCTAHQLASGLRWTLPRTIQALERLDARLANTGQVLRRDGHHSYELAPREELIRHDELARCFQHDSRPISLDAANALCRIFNTRRDERLTATFASPAEQAAVKRLRDAGLVQERLGALRPTALAEATFGMTIRGHLAHISTVVEYH